MNMKRNRSDTMDNQTKAIFGAWIAAIGTIMSAVGSTPSNRLSEEKRNALNLWGNVLQGTGNALMADAEEGVSINKIGNEIQAIGNSTVITGIVIDFKEETKLRLNITGNWMQALGGAAAFGDGLTGYKNKGEALEINGNLLQAIGNSLQALSGTAELKESDKNRNENDSTSLNVIGSWIQAVGSVLSLLGVIAEPNSDGLGTNT